MRGAKPRYRTYNALRVSNRASAGELAGRARDNAYAVAGLVLFLPLLVALAAVEVVLLPIAFLLSLLALPLTRSSFATNLRARVEKPLFEALSWPAVFVSLALWLTCAVIAFAPLLRDIGATPHATARVVIFAACGAYFLSFLGPAVAGLVTKRWFGAGVLMVVLMFALPLLLILYYERAL